jgi:hypothetical protein
MSIRTHFGGCWVNVRFAVIAVTAAGGVAIVIVIESFIDDAAAIVVDIVANFRG